MKKKRNDIITILFISFIFISFSVASLAGVDRYYSAKEDRILTARPAFTTEGFLFGDYAEQYEAYARDQFVSRDKWITIKQQLDLISGKREVAGLYLGRDGYLFEKHLPGDYTGEQEDAQLSRLKAFAEKWQAKVMLVPTAETVLSEKLPNHAPVYDQNAFLEKASGVLGNDIYVDVCGTLLQNKDRQLYFKSDIHWTAEAAYLCYGTWVKSTGKLEYPYYLYEWNNAPGEYQGPLQTLLNMDWASDTISFLEETDRKLVSVTYDYRKTADSLYEEEWLGTDNPYGFFMDEEHVFTEIHTNRNKGDRLFVIGDSYANAFIPFLLSHYDTIYVLNMDKCDEAYEKYLNKYARLGSKKLEVLVLGSVPELLENFSY